MASTLGETLKNQLGVHSSSFGPGVGVPVLRGQSGQRVEVLQNGTTVADVSDTSSDHAVGTEALLADRIEILRGPATLRYGSGAIGGVVNVIDSRIHSEVTEGISGKVETRYNENNDESVVVGRVDAGFGNWGLHLDGVTRDSSDIDIPGIASLEADDLDETTVGFLENSDSEADSFSIGLSWVGDNIVTGFSVSDLDSNYGLPPGGHHDEEEVVAGPAPGPEPEEEEEFVRIDLEQTQYQGKLLLKNLAGVWNHLDIDLNYTDYEHDELEIEGDEVEVGTTFDVDSLEIRSELTHSEVNLGGNDWIGAIGFQYVDRDFFAEGEEAFVEPSTTERYGIYLLEEAEIGPGVFELGLRFDQQDFSSNVDGARSIDHDLFNISASYLYNINDSQRLGVIFSGAERAPVAEELISDGLHIATDTYEIGDATLDTESSFNAEITWSLETRSGISAQASLFYSDFDDYIFLENTGLRFTEQDGLVGINNCAADSPTFEADFGEEFDEAVECFVYNQEGASFTGIEAEASFGLTSQSSLRLWGDYVEADLDDSGDVPRIPPARLGASWDYSYEAWSGQLSLTHAFDQNDPGEGEEETEGYTRVDAYIGWNAEPLTIFFKATNLTDDDIRNATSFTRELAPEPGRGFTLGARYNF